MQDEDSHERVPQVLKHNLGRGTVAAELLLWRCAPSLPLFEAAQRWHAGG